MLCNFKHHTNTFQTIQNILHIHQSIVFGHLLLRQHYSMAPPGLDPEEGSQRFSLFWWDFSSPDLGLSRSSPRPACFLFKLMDVSTCVYVPTVRLSSSSRESIPILFLFPTLLKTMIPSTSIGQQEYQFNR